MTFKAKYAANVVIKLLSRVALVVTLAVAVIVVLGQTGLAQDNESEPNEPPYNMGKVSDDLSVDSEVDAVNGPSPTTPQVQTPPSAPAPSPTQPSRPAVGSNKLEASSQGKQEPFFTKPPGPKQGGVLRVPHPNVAKGLSRINQDGSYQYKVRMKPKSQSAAFRLGLMAPPKISGDTTATGSRDFASFYGKSNILALNFDYEWQPFTQFGRLGFILGGGFATVRGNGYFKKDGTKAEEVYNLYIVPLSAFLDYRFEYKRRQWAVPFIKAGATYFGLVEARDDNKAPTLAGAPAIGGGGGVHFSITAFDSQGAFVLDREYGIADMYVTLEAQVLQGVSSDIDFSTQSVNLGITVDF